MVTVRPWPGSPEPYPVATTPKSPSTTPSDHRMPRKEGDGDRKGAIHGWTERGGAGDHGSGQRKRLTGYTLAKSKARAGARGSASQNGAGCLSMVAAVEPDGGFCWRSGYRRWQGGKRSRWGRSRALGGVEGERRLNGARRTPPGRLRRRTGDTGRPWPVRGQGGMGAMRRRGRQAGWTGRAGFVRGSRKEGRGLVT
jgi:hypothetical protein